MAKTALERIEAKIIKRGKDECWGWAGGFARKRGGIHRPKVCYLGETTNAFRALLIEIYGTSVADVRGLHACHSCDDPTCMNGWDHGFWGTPDRNRADRVERHGGHFARIHKSDRDLVPF
jgi:hypothetical protein